MLFAIASVLATPPITFPIIATLALALCFCARRARLADQRRLVARMSR